MFPISDSIKSARFPFLNITIIAFTMFVFYLQITSPDIEAFISAYALVPSRVDFSNLSTLIPFATSIFLHGGFLHIISNMWFLWVFGDNVEGRMSFLVYPFFYFISGIAASLAQYVFMPNSDIPMLGASGAVAGVLGAYYVLFPHARIKTVVFIFFFVTIVEISAPVMLGYWFVLQLLSGAFSLPFASTTGGVAFFAHVGGFLTGMILARFFKSGD